MNNVKISVVIPVYNVERYLRDCVNSVQKQTHSYLQIILVDDGSTDGSGALCDRLAETDGRICVIHKANGGLSDARNVGIKEVSGEFVFYLDSDDYLEKNALEKLLTLICDEHCDIAICGYYYTYSDYEDIANSAFKDCTVLDNHTAMEALVSGQIQNFAWGKLMRAGIAERHQFPKGKLFEDTYWTHLAFSDSERIAFLPTPLLHYRQRDGSISYSLTIKRLDVLEGWHARIAFLKEHYPDLLVPYLSFLSRNYVGIAWLVLTRMKHNRVEAFRKMKEFNKMVHLQDYAEGKTKVLIEKLDRSTISYIVWAAIERISK